MKCFQEFPTASFQEMNTTPCYIPGFHCSEVPYSRNSMQGDTICQHAPQQIKGGYRLIRVCRRQQSDHSFHLSRGTHRFAQFLPFSHQPISRRTATVLRRRGSPSAQTHRRFVARRSVFQIDQPEFPLPLIHSTESVKEFLLPMEAKLAQLLELCAALKLLNSWP